MKTQKHHRHQHPTATAASPDVEKRRKNGEKSTVEKLFCWIVCVYCYACMRSYSRPQSHLYIKSLAHHRSSFSEEKKRWTLKKTAWNASWNFMLSDFTQRKIEKDLFQRLGKKLWKWRNLKFWCVLFYRTRHVSVCLIFARYHSLRQNAKHFLRFVYFLWNLNFSLNNFFYSSFQKIFTIFYNIT